MHENFAFLTAKKVPIRGVWHKFKAGKKSKRRTALAHPADRGLRPVAQAHFIIVE
jgi:hypothetical protein